ncbi:MAG: methanobactin biosynthesis cassette protein MbnC [Methylothermaceae bacterium]|nr:methanobactin biosynthesis cassette protein MbnC [Methylothermaceae bacterium]
MHVRPNQKVAEKDLLDAMMVPARQADYPRQSRAFVRLDTSLRVYWHNLFDICPELLELSDTKDGLSVFHPFMAWAAEQQLSMNWTYYLWVYRWLLESPLADRITEDVTLSLISASAARWAIGDRSLNCGIVIGFAGLDDLIVGWKCHRIDGGREVERLTLESSLPSPRGIFGYFVTPEFVLDRFPGWSEIPK